MSSNPDETKLDCPHFANTEKLIFGKLSGKPLADAMEHLLQCDTCSALSENIPASDTFAQQKEEFEFANESGISRLQDFARKLKLETDSQLHETPHDDETMPDLESIKQAPRFSLPFQVENYELVELLGSGGFGWVYRAIDRKIRRPVAIKIGYRTGSNSTKRAFDEAAAVAKVSHPGVATVHTVGTLPTGEAYLVMQLVEGRTLSVWAKINRPSVDEIIEMVAKICDAIQAAHAKGITHRDLKPANILVKQSDQPVVVDFGLAQDETNRFEHHGEIAGTSSYISPEIIQGNSSQIDGRSDIWSIGVVLYELLTGKRPFDGALGQMIDEIETREVRPIRQLNEKVPAPLAEICEKCLKKDPVERFSSAKDLAIELRSLIKPEVKKNDFQIRMTIVVTGFVLMVMSVVVIWKFGDLWQTNPSNGSGGHQTAVFKEDVWNELTNPTLHLGAEGTDTDKWYFDDAAKEIHVDSQFPMFIKLGETDQNNFKLAVQLQKNSWTGDFGFFWGVDPKQLGSDDPFDVQMIRIRIKNGRFLLEHEHLSMSLPDNHPVASNKREVSKSKLLDKQHGPEEVLFQIHVRNGRLHEVIFGGGGKLSGFEPIEPGNFPGSRGIFGVVNARGATNFRRAEFMPLERK